jgi:hypothetical protein
MSRTDTAKLVRSHGRTKKKGSDILTRLETMDAQRDDMEAKAVEYISVLASEPGNDDVKAAWYSIAVRGLVRSHESYKH